MEITKIYSDPWEEGRYYSVLLTEEELRLYSELQKEFGVKRKIISKIGHARVNLAGKLAKSAEKNELKLNQAGELMECFRTLNERRFFTPELGRKLVKKQTSIMRWSMD